MKKSFGVSNAFILSAHSTLAGEFVAQPTRLIDRLNLPILSGLRRTSRQPYSFSFAPPMRLNSAVLSDYAARQKRRSSDPLELYPVERPTNNLLHIRF